MQGATLAAIFLAADVSSLPSSTYGCPTNEFNTLNEVVYSIAIVIIPKAVRWFKEPEQLVFFFRPSWQKRLLTWEVSGTLKVGTGHNPFRKEQVPPQYLHKCSGGLVEVGTNEKSREGRKTRNKKKKVQNYYSLSVEVLFGIVNMRSLRFSCKCKQKKKNRKKKKKLKKTLCISHYSAWVCPQKLYLICYVVMPNLMFATDYSIQIKLLWQSLLILSLFRFQNSRYCDIRSIYGGFRIPFHCIVFHVSTILLRTEYSPIGVCQATSSFYFFLLIPS